MMMMLLQVPMVPLMMRLNYVRTFFSTFVRTYVSAKP